MAKPGDPEDLEPPDPPLADEAEPEDLQDDALVEDEADEESEPDQPDASEQPETRQPEQPPPSRRERRIEALTTSLAEERRQREELNRRLDAVLAGRQQASQPQESPEARAQRLALLTPEERITAELQDAKQSFALQMHQMQISNKDANDKAAFQAKATVDAYYKKWEPHVEAELAKLRNTGYNADRENVMFYLIGKAAVAGRKSPETRKQRVEAQRRVQRQQTRPSNSGSDVSAARSRGSSLERRLENVEL